MNILFLSPSLSRDAGGIFEIEKCLAKALAAQGTGVEAIGLNDSNWPKDKCQWDPVPASVVDVKGPKSFGYSPELIRQSMAVKFDLVHLHALWMYPSIAAKRLAQGTGRPLIVTPNGMLEPWALNNAAWKKRIAGALYERAMLKSATCIQANTRKEMLDIRAYGLNNPVAIIPNGIDLPDLPEVSGCGRTREAGGGKKILLFLGRLHPKKGLVNALRAWAIHSKSKTKGSGFSEWKFVIAGWDQGGHEADLKQLCDELGLVYDETPASELTENHQLSTSSEASVVFVGPVFGAEKDRLLRLSSAFILPSFSEGLPMSVLEAWSYGLPVLMTEHCNILEGFAAEAAIHIGTDRESIVEGFSELFHSQESELQSYGRNGRALVERQYTWTKVAAQLEEVYRWAIGEGDKPDSVS